MSPPGPGSEFLTREEVAKRLRVSKRTVRRLAASGDLEQVWVSPQRALIKAESVERHITRNTGHAYQAAT